MGRLSMTPNRDAWRPGSFTKNFSWGKRSSGLLQLHNTIRQGFADTMEDVPRSTFRRRLGGGASRPDFIPINFFLFNKPINGVDHVIADELVFQALSTKHSSGFDKLALFAFNFSFAGKWARASPDQRRPAMWANVYVCSRVADQFDWNTSRVNADDIQQFVSEDPRYKGATSRKLATNLNYLYSIGRLSEFASNRIERWWVDALFLALDRLIENRELDGKTTLRIRICAAPFAIQLHAYQRAPYPRKRAGDKASCPLVFCLWKSRTLLRRARQGSDSAIGAGYGEIHCQRPTSARCHSPFKCSNPEEYPPSLRHACKICGIRSDWARRYGAF